MQTNNCIYVSIYARADYSGAREKGCEYDVQVVGQKRQ